MKNKTIFVVLCAVLLLLFTSLSYGWWGNLRPQPLEPREYPRPHDLDERLRAHGWQEDVRRPCTSPGANGSTPNVNLTSVNSAENIIIVVPIRFGNIDLFFMQQKSELPSDKHSITFSHKK